MMARPIAGAIVLTATLSLGQGVQAAEFTSIDPSKSSLKFTFKEMGVAIDGSFKKYNAKVRFDPKNLKQASASIDLDLASIDAGSDEANDEVVGKSWFDVKTYPQAHFESESVSALGADKYQVAGKLTIKGRTRPVTAAFTVVAQGSTAVADGGFVIKRADFSIGEGVWADFGTVANEIPVVFHWQLSGK
jgi:polyisoprenoid-binding protein YceI